MGEAKSEMLVFVDDDNVLDPDYLQQALRIEREWPMLGVWGCGVSRPEFEVRPADKVRDYLDKLAIRENTAAYFSNVMPCYRAVAWGTGQCVRASVADAYRQHFENSPIKIKDRTGNSLESAGDLEIVYVACSLGSGVGIFPQLKLTHLIPKERLNEDYLVKLIEGVETSIALVEYKWLSVIPGSPFAGVLGIPRVMRNLVARKGIQRRMYLAELRSKGRVRATILQHERKNREPASQPSPSARTIPVASADDCGLPREAKS
jgi:hypothetical protein